jgi:hypothetical protein
MDRSKNDFGGRESPVPSAAAATPNDAREVTRLRNLAVWYREFADKAAVPWIWEGRLRHAEELDREADLLAARSSGRSGRMIPLV